MAIYLFPGLVGLSLLTDGRQPGQVSLGLVSLSFLMQFPVVGLSPSSLKSLPFSPALWLLDTQAGYSLGGLVNIDGLKLLARSLGVVRVGGHAIVLVVFRLAVAGGQVADLYGGGFCLGDSGVLAGLLLLLAVFAAEFLGGGRRRRAGAVVGLFFRLLVGFLLRVRLVLLSGVGAPHGNLISVGVEGSQVAREVLTACWSPCKRLRS